MATYSNQHWLLSHIRNSFISTDDTGMCETVMVSDDLPKHFLRKFQTNVDAYQPQRKSLGGNANGNSKHKNLDGPLQEVDFICYPGLDQSDDEDIDLAAQSFDIQMYPEVGAHRFRSNTAQKLEKMDIARRKAARTKCVNYDDEVLPPERPDFFVRKPLANSTKTEQAKKPNTNGDDADDDDVMSCTIKSKLTLQLANSPKQVQNKFIEYARFDGTSQLGLQTKRINVFLSMLPERERNYPIKICVLATAKIVEVIGLVCYKASIQYPDVPLKSIRHYALYMTEDNDDMDDFPPLDNREPCSKFGFSHLTLAERRPLAPVTRIDYNPPTKSMTSEEDKVILAEAALRSLQSIELNTGLPDEDTTDGENADKHINEYEERILSHNDMLEAPMYRTYRLQMVDKRFFKSDVTLAISGERIDIDQHKNAKFWTQKRAFTIPIDAVACCEIVERRHLRATVRIWIKSNSSSSTTVTSSSLVDNKSTTLAINTPGSSSVGCNSSTTSAHSPASPSHYASPFTFFSTGVGGQQNQPQIRFKHYDFETNLHMAEQIRNKLNCILGVRSSDVRREFLHQRERKQEKSQAKKQLKL